MGLQYRHHHRRQVCNTRRHGYKARTSAAFLFFVSLFPNARLDSESLRLQFFHLNSSLWLANPKLQRLSPCLNRWTLFPFPSLILFQIQSHTRLPASMSTKFHNFIKFPYSLRPSTSSHSEFVHGPKSYRTRRRWSHRSAKLGRSRHALRMVPPSSSSNSPSSSS